MGDFIAGGALVIVTFLLGICAEAWRDQRARQRDEQVGQRDVLDRLLAATDALEGTINEVSSEIIERAKAPGGGTFGPLDDLDPVMREHLAARRKFWIVLEQVDDDGIRALGRQYADETLNMITADSNQPDSFARRLVKAGEARVKTAEELIRRVSTARRATF